MRIIGFDTETTGVDNTTARIVTAALVNNNNGKVNEKEFLINPGVPIPPEAAAIHGVSTEHAEKHGMDPKPILDKIARTLEKADKILVYNAIYDLPLLDHELERHGYKKLDSELKHKVIDPYILDKHFDKYRKGKRTLGVTAEHYGVTIVGDLHNATTDVHTTMKLYEAMKIKYPAIKNFTGKDMYDLQKNAYWKWATGFNKFKGKEIVNTDWL